MGLTAAGDGIAAWAKRRPESVMLELGTEVPWT